MFLSNFFQRNRSSLCLIILVFTFILKGFSQNNITNSYSNENLDFYKFTHNGIWSWFSDPRAVYFEGKHKKIYTGWIDNYGDIYIASYNTTTEKLTTSIVYNALEIDDHNNPSLLVDKAGFIHVFFTSHTINEQPIYYLKSKNAEDIKSWQKLQRLDLLKKSKTTKNTIINNTYSNPIQLSAENNKMYLFWRGLDYKPYYSTSTDGAVSWAEGQLLFSPSENTFKTVPYTKVFSNNISKIHFTFTNTHPKSNTINALYYAYYENGYFYKANGKKIKSIKDLPLTEDELDIVYNSDNHKVWNWDIAEDNNGNPVVGFASFEGKENHIYNYSKFQNGHWVNQRLINSGNWFPKDQNPNTQPEPYYSGGMSINHDDPNTIYLSIKKNGVFEIEKWSTKNNGKDWKKTPITKNSQFHNVRPYAIKNTTDTFDMNLLWVTIENYSYYGLRSNQVKTFSNRYKSRIYANASSRKISYRFNKKNVLEFTNKLHDNILTQTKFNSDPFSVTFNMFFEASKHLSQVSDNVVKLNELKNIIEILGEDIEVDKLSIEGLLWYKDFEENREITVRLSEIDITSFDIKSNAYQFVLLTRLIDLNPDNLVTDEAQKYIENTINTKNGFDWLTKSESQFGIDVIFNKSIILYSKFWLHKNGLIQFDIEELNENAEKLYKLAVKQYLKKTGFKDIKTISLFTLVMTEFIKMRPSF